MHKPWRDMPVPGGPDISTSLTADETALLSRLAEGRRVLEVGSAYGYSAITMAQAGALSVLSVDPHTAHGSADAMRRARDIRGAEVRMLIESSQTALPSLAEGRERFGLIFIDGDHTAFGCLHDLIWARGLLEPGGILVVDDADEECCCPGVGRACKAFVPENAKSWMVDTMLVIEGLA